MSNLQRGLRVGGHLALADFHSDEPDVNSRIRLRAVGDIAINIVLRIVIILLCLKHKAAVVKHCTKQCLLWFIIIIIIL